MVNQLIHYFVLGLFGTVILFGLVSLIIFATNKPEEVLDIILRICVFCIVIAIICGIGYGISLLPQLFH